MAFPTALLGESSGEFNEGASSLEVVHLGISNSLNRAAPDAFTQRNPPIVQTANTISLQADTTKNGILGGSVAFTRPDIGSNYVGGNVESLAVAALETFIRPVGVFGNDALGNSSFENQPAVASQVIPYVSAQGTYINKLYETQVLDGTGITNFATGDTLPYVVGVELIASRNGYLMPREIIDGGGAVRSADDAANAAEVEHGRAASTTIAILKVTPDAALAALSYDQRI